MSQDSLRALFFEYAGTDLDSFLQVDEFMTFAIDAGLVTDAVHHLVLVRLFDRVVQETHGGAAAAAESGADEASSSASASASLSVPEASLNIRAFLVLLERLREEHGVRLEQVIDRLLTIDSNLKPSKRRSNAFVHDRELIELVYADKYRARVDALTLSAHSAQAPVTVDGLIEHWKHCKFIPGIFVTGEVREAAKKLLITPSSVLDRCTGLELFVLAVLRAPVTGGQGDISALDRVHAALEKLQDIETAENVYSEDMRIMEITETWHLLLDPLSFSLEEEAEEGLWVGELIEEPVGVPKEFGIVENVRAMRKAKQYDAAIRTLLAGRAQICGKLAQKSAPGVFRGSWDADSLGNALDGVRSRQRGNWSLEEYTVEKIVNTERFEPACDEFFNVELASLLIGAEDYVNALAVLEKLRTNITPNSPQAVAFWQTCGRAMSAVDLPLALRCYLKARDLQEMQMKTNIAPKAMGQLGNLYHNAAVIFARLGLKKRAKIFAAFAGELLQGDLRNPRVEVNRKFMNELML